MATPDGSPMPPLARPLPALAPMDEAGRLGRLRAAHDTDATPLIVTTRTNVRYLTGFTGSAGTVVVTADRATLVTDGRYGEQAETQIGAAGATVDVEIVLTGPEGDAALLAAIGSAGRVGLEAADVTWAAQRRWADAFTGVELRATEGVVEGLRAHKDAGELARLEAAAAIADAALAEVRGLLAEAPTEATFGAELDAAMRRRGADDVSFETIVASGPNGARPHHRPSDRTVRAGDLVVVDFGALVDGYHSDMTRTLVVGDTDATAQRMLDVVTGAQALGVASVRAGVAARDVDAACRDHITEAGWGDAFLHGTGHGVGLDIHEDPRVGRTSTATLEASCVVTVEPGVYLAGIGGVRVEDTVVVTTGGCTPLTHAPKDHRV